MRTEREMMDLIIGVANGDDRIRAAYMNGSRTNPSAPNDNFQDYDVVYVVTETKSFVNDKGWPLKFGNPLIVQEPDWNDNQWAEIGSGVGNRDGAGGADGTRDAAGAHDIVGIVCNAAAAGQKHDFTRRYAWLMLFDDGNRIDLGVELLDEALKNFLDDKLTLTLLDKDGVLPRILPPTDVDYRIKPPTEGRFIASCNEFWWCLNNVAKGIARDEPSYTMYMLNEIVRAELHNMIDWHIGVCTDFTVSAGKNGKYYKRYLPPNLYERFTATYSGAGRTDVWAAVRTMCDLFRQLALDVAAGLGFTYRQHEEDGMRRYLSMVESGVI